MKMKIVIKILPLLLITSLTLTLLPVTALAASDPANFIFDVSEGNVSIYEDAGGLHVNYGNPLTTVDVPDNNQEITITGTTRNYTIYVWTTTISVNITLRNVNIDVSGRTGLCAFFIDSKPIAVNLTLEGNNTLASGDFFAGLFCAQPSALTIGVNSDPDGSLTAIGGDSAAGIGGSNEASGAITISSGTVTANGGGAAAGIGGAYGAGVGGEVTISGGTVTATAGHSWGAGIGGGYYGHGGKVTISGGTVIATGGDMGAGIGGGYRGNGGEVTISGGTVAASGFVGIGGGSGYVGSGGTLKNAYGADVFPTVITLEGVAAKTPINSLTSSANYYGMNDVFTDASGKLYLYLPQGAVTLGAQTPSTRYEGGAITADSPTDFTFREAALAEREIELRTGENYIQWRYTDETDWHDLVELSAITGPQGEAGADGQNGKDGANGADGKDGRDGVDGQNGANGMDGQNGKDGANGRDGINGADGRDGVNGADGKDGSTGNGIKSIEKTGTEGYVDTYTITFTNGTKTTFTVTNGRDGVGIESSAVNEYGEIVFTLTNGKQLKITADMFPASGESGTNATATIALVIAAIALLSHLG
ncbi:MAG: hypothetical protein ACM3S4_04625 [Burkholderiales bacterium]